MNAWDYAELTVVCGLCLFGLFELWRLRGRATDPVWIGCVVVLCGLLFTHLGQLLSSRAALDLWIRSFHVLALFAVIGGLVRFRQENRRLLDELRKKRRAQRELARNREHLQHLISKRTEALRGEILQRKSLQDDLAHHSAALEKDLSAAARAQAAMQLGLPEVEYLKIAAQTFARDQVNGDLFHVRKLDDGSVNLLVGDAMGHGAAAGFMTVLTHTALRMMSQDLGPLAVLTALNQLMIEQNTGVFMTAVMARIEPDGRCRVAHAGHPPALLCRPDGEVEEVPGGGFALGMFEIDSLDSEETSLHLNPGDRLLLFSDGLSEIRSPSGEEFGQQRLMRELRRCEGGMEDCLGHLLELAYDHADNRAVGDDVTLLMAEYRGR